MSQIAKGPHILAYLRRMLTRSLLAGLIIDHIDIAVGGPYHSVGTKPAGIAKPVGIGQGSVWSVQ